MKKKLLSFAAIIIANSLFSQITFQHSFSENEYMRFYTTNDTMFYIGEVNGYLKIYNADFSLRKIVTIPVSSNYSTQLRSESFSVSKNIFNNDDKYEFMITAGYYDAAANKSYSKILLINEDGELIKDFHPNAGTINGGIFDVFHDPISNQNKLLISNYSALIGGNDQFDVFSLPSSSLTTKEIQSNNKLTAFPIPTNKTLNIVNPKNGTSKIEIYDTNGKLVVNKSFSISDNKISIDVENLPVGNYVYKIGNQSSKFIKY